MSTHAKWQSGKLSFYDGHETVKPFSPVVFEDDFLGTSLDKVIASTNANARWKTVETSINLAPAYVDDATNGIVQITCDADDVTLIGALYHGDNLQFSLKNGLMMEFRAELPVLPTTADSTLTTVVMGLASAHHATPDSVATNVWFRAEGSGALLWESDDGNTDDNDNATSVTASTAVYNTYRIDARSLANGVKFYIDSALVGTTADFSTNLTASEAKVQPYFRVSKVKGGKNVNTGTLYIDYVKIWQNRS
jgi:hypothetical protein